MKPITAIIVFFSLMFPALFLGYNNYAEAKENITIMQKQKRI